MILQPAPQYITGLDFIVSPWQTAQEASAGDNCNEQKGCNLGRFAAACYYFAETLTDRMLAEVDGEAAVVPFGLIMSAFGGTMIGKA